MGKLINLTGCKFNRLTVIKRIYPNRKDRNPMWLCKCECGKEKIINGRNLREDRTQSCGCLQKERTSESRRLTSGLSSMRSKIITYKWNAKRKYLEYSLTEEQFKEISEKDCFYCGAKPNNTSKESRHFGEYIYNGLDRIDNSKGYTIDNVVPCCKQCNQAKSVFTLQEFRDWIERVYKKIIKIGREGE